MRAVLILAACWGSARASASEANDPALLRLRQGTARGLLHRRSRAWLGLPFAAPPVGELRWRAPQPAPSWPGVRDATRAGPNCAQVAGFDPPMGDTQEDCLTLNVFAPLANASRRKLPVLVYLHGGNDTGGGANETRLNGTWAMARLAAAGDEPVIIVVPNYRLGPFGFLGGQPLRDGGGSGSGDGGSVGNWGVQDQRAALQWVRANAAALGADPARVLLFGQSAGTGNTAVHLAAPANHNQAQNQSKRHER